METYNSNLVIARRLKNLVQAERLVGLILPREAINGFPGKEIVSPNSLWPFQKMFRIGSTVIACLDTNTMLQQKIVGIRVLKVLQSEVLIVGFSCFPLRRTIHKGSYVIIKDHVNWTGENPLRGHNDRCIGERYPNMNAPYDKNWSLHLGQIADRMAMRYSKAVYGRVRISELKNQLLEWREMGCDVMGEGLVDEVISSVHCRLPVAAVGIVERIDFDRGGSVKIFGAGFSQITRLIKNCL